jgi:hypothetical protein
VILQIVFCKTLDSVQRLQFVGDLARSVPPASVMRLLHTKKLCFEEFFDSKVPQDAILSHRWEDGEVSFQDFEEGKKKDGAGYRKILNCCTLAKSQAYNWVWMDTCCIDKKS